MVHRAPCRIESDDFQHLRNALINATTLGEMKHVIESCSKELETYLRGCELQGDANKPRAGKNQLSVSENESSEDEDISGDEDSSNAKKQKEAPRKTAKPKTAKPKITKRAAAARVADRVVPPSIDALGLFRRAHLVQPRESPRVSDNPLVDLYLRNFLNEKLAAGPVGDGAQTALKFLLTNINGTNDIMDVLDDGTTNMLSVVMAKFFKAVGVTRAELEPVFEAAGVPMPPKFQDL